jgi:hypothetical protein
MALDIGIIPTFLQKTKPKENNTTNTSLFSLLYHALPQIGLTVCFTTDWCNNDYEAKQINLSIGLFNSDSCTKKYLGYLHHIHTVEPETPLKHR